MLDHRPSTIYRPDIDGLRAVAVLLVVTFHAAPNWIPGGFIGVDLFFVISGYLITSIITAGLQKGNFSFRTFYSKRVRRIFPALGLVLASCMGLGWWLLLAEEYAQLGKHVAAGAGFLSNIALWQESGYFDQGATLKPLLHLWSLSVEEQFYFLWPLALWVAWRKKWPLLPTMVVLLVLSFGANLRAIIQDASGAYYLPWNRFWEILAGGVLAQIGPLLGGTPAGHGKPLISSRTAHILSGLGALSIAVGISMITEDSPFPGWWALLPVAGGVLIIGAGPTAWVNKLLAYRPLVFVGLISYPLYLWHWPLLSFAHILYGQTPPPVTIAGAVLLAFVLSVLTYYGLELPLRRLRNQALVTGCLLAFLGTMVFAGAWVYVRDGVPSRPHGQAKLVYQGDINHHEIFNLMSGKFHVCTPQSMADQADRWEGHVRCMQSQANNLPDVALVGDSHAEHLFLGLAEQYPEHNIAYFLKVGAAFSNNPDFTAIFDHVENSASIKHVVLTMSWPRRARKIPKNSTLDAELLKLARRFMATGKTVYITTDIPHFAFGPNRCRLQRPLALNKGEQCEAELPIKQDVLNALHKVIAQEPSIKLLDTYPYLCKGTTCSMVRDGELLYRDRTHLNILGSRYVGRKIHGAYPDLFSNGR